MQQGLCMPVKGEATRKTTDKIYGHHQGGHLLLNLRSPRDYVGSSVRSFAPVVLP